MHSSLNKHGFVFRHNWVIPRQGLLQLDFISSRRGDDGEGPTDMPSVHFELDLRQVRLAILIGMNMLELTYSVCRRTFTT
jgi:hypothetical protein